MRTPPLSVYPTTSLLTRSSQSTYLQSVKLTLLFISVLLHGASLSAQEAQSWTTTEDLRLTLEKDSPLSFRVAEPSAGMIEIDPARKFQSILGIGASFEHSTCSNLFRISPQERSRVIEDLVSPSRGIGMNLMRICIGTSDFAGEDWYSYDDLPARETDSELKHFSIARDRSYILPILKLAKEKNPGLLFFASPWSPPGWMKTTENMIGGELLPKWYDAYADYFVRFIQAYEKEGIPIYAITVQNEPGVDRSKEKDPKWFYPSCHWTAEQEHDFIRDHLGPTFRHAGLKTEIWCYDHNYNVEPKPGSDGLSHPRAILTDARAAAFVDGVAFHHYEGEPAGMSVFHNEFPNTPIYFSEGSVFSIYGGHDLIERFRNWACSYNAWVTILDEAGQPNRGPFPATSAILRLSTKTQKCEKLFEFYNYAHFSKFIQRGAVRIQSTRGNQDLNNVAFLNPDGTFVSVVVNTTTNARPVTIRSTGKSLIGSLPPKAIRTLVWRATP